MNRRDFIYSSSIISTATIVGAKSTVKSIISTPPSVGYYMARSGNFKNDNFYLLGIFEIADPEAISQQIDSIKLTHNYKTKISYNTNDKFKIPVAKDLINLFVANNISVTALLEISNPSNDPRSGFQLKINALKRVLGDGFESDLIAKNESYYGPSNQMKENFHSALGGQLISERTDQSLILQMTDLINGCIFGAIHNEITNPTKLEIINYFKSKIGINNFTKGTIKQNKLEII